MFEGAPLVVPEAVALRVAPDPSSWIDALRPTSEGTAGPEVAAAGDTSGLLSDVPMSIWMYAARRGGGLADATSAPSSVQLAKASLDLARTALGRSGQPDEDELDPWGCLSAAVLFPSVAVALAETVGPADREVLVRLGESLAEPAASWCNESPTHLRKLPERSNPRDGSSYHHTTWPLFPSRLERRGCSTREGKRACAH